MVNERLATLGPNEPPTVEPAEPRCPAWHALLLSWILPATTATCTQHVSLRRAFGIHLFAALFGLSLIVFCVEWSERPLAGGWFSAMDGTAGVVLDYLNAWIDQPFETLVWTVGALVATETFFVVLAMALCSWGAADEPLRASIRSSLRQTWLHTPHFLPAVVYVGAVAILMGDARREWYELHRAPIWPAMPNPVTLAPDEPGYAEAEAKHAQDLAEYNALVTEVQQRWSEWRLRQPWYVRYEEVPSINAGCLAALWMLWALLRAIGAPRRIPTAPRPVICDACGYNLTGTEPASRCPECGEPARHSYEPVVRCGVPWEHRFELGTLRAGWQSLRAAFLSPRVLGRQLCVRRRVTVARGFHGLFLPVVYVVTFAGFPMTIFLVDGSRPLIREPEILLIGSPVLATLAVLGTAVYVNLASFLAALLHRGSGRFNLAPGAVQIACYLTPLLAVWVLFGMATLGGLMALSEDGTLKLYAQAVRLSEPELAFGLWTILNGAWLLAFLILVTRGAATTRFANH